MRNSAWEGEAIRVAELLGALARIAPRSALCGDVDPSPAALSPALVANGVSVTGCCTYKASTTRSCCTYKGTTRSLVMSSFEFNGFPLES